VAWTIPRIPTVFGPSSFPHASIFIGPLQLLHWPDQNRSKLRCQNTHALLGRSNAVHSNIQETMRAFAAGHLQKTGLFIKLPPHVSQRWIFCKPHNSDTLLSVEFYAGVKAAHSLTIHTFWRLSCLYHVFYWKTLPNLLCSLLRLWLRLKPLSTIL